ncbi:MAG: flagellar motor protein MotB [Fidelibacterota bacterium]
MARRVKRVSLSESKARSTAWAVTFGDMITLLLTFFIMLLVIMNDAEKHVDRIINMLLDETYQELHSQLHSAYVSVERVTKGVKITMASGRLFPSGEAELRPEVYPLIQQIGMIIKMSRLVRVHEDPELRPFIDAVAKSDRNLNIEIRCEGHTDNVPLPRFLQDKWESNWELSTARALNVVELLRQFAGIEEGKFSAMGYGEFRPVSSNASPEGRSKNRRVEIYLDAFLTTKTASLAI